MPDYVQQVQTAAAYVAAHIPELYAPDRIEVTRASYGFVPGRAQVQGSSRPPCSLNVLNARIVVEELVERAAWLLQIGSPPARSAVTVSWLLDVCAWIQEKAPLVVVERLREVAATLGKALKAAISV